MKRDASKSVLDTSKSKWGATKSVLDATKSVWGASKRKRDSSKSVLDVTKTVWVVTKMLWGAPLLIGAATKTVRGASLLTGFAPLLTGATSPAAGTPTGGLIFWRRGLRICAFGRKSVTKKKQQDEIDRIIRAIEERDILLRKEEKKAKITPPHPRN